MRPDVETFGILWDVENFVYHKQTNGCHYTVNEKVGVIRRIASALPLYMEHHGFVPDAAWQLVFAGPNLLDCYAAALRDFGYQVDLLKRCVFNGADKKFLAAIEEGVYGQRPTLPSLICILTGDAGFYQHVRRLRHLQREVWVMNTSHTVTGRVLLHRRGAHKFVTFSKMFELIGEEPPSLACIS